jgi:cytochrome c551/c552
MQFLEQFALAPSAEHLLLLKILIVLLLLIHVPFASLFMGGSLLSFVFTALDKREKNPRYERFSSDLMNLITGNAYVTFLLGLLPLATLLFVFAQIYQNSPLLIANYLAVVIAFAFFGFAMIHLYASRAALLKLNFALRLGIGGLGFLFLLSAYFIFSSSTSLILEPDRWPFIKEPFPTFFSANVIPRFSYFLTLIFSIAGIGIPYLLLNWYEKAAHFEADYRDFIFKLGTQVALASILLQPIFIVWNLVTFADVAVSDSVFHVWMIVLFLLMIVAVRLFSGLQKPKSKKLTGTVVLYVLAFLFIFAGDQIAGDNANREFEKSLTGRSEMVRAKLAAEREERAAALSKVDGEEIFNRICMTCHRFDQKVVGPPLNSVLPKYRSNAEALKGFLLNPAKMDPAYPPMPNPGLTKSQTNAVAEYVLNKVQ